MTDATAAPVAGGRRVVHFRWDLDKTYLRTEFDTLADLVRTFRTPAHAREVVPGAPALLRELLGTSQQATAGVDGRLADERRVTFISGSPRQMRKVLTEKLALDGITPDAFWLKPNLSNLLTLRLGAVRDQLGYKLDALLHSTVDAEEVDELLFGDDAEQDALVYSLYADLVEGRVELPLLEDLLRAGRVHRREADSILRQFDQRLQTRTRVRRIFIHLDRRSPVVRFDVFGDRVVPVYNYFQAAVLLFEDRWLDAGALVRVAASMVSMGYSLDRLAGSLQDLARRGRVARETLARVSAEGAQNGLQRDLAERWHVALADVMRGVESYRHRELPAPDPSVYLSLVCERGRYRRETFADRAMEWLR